MSAWSLTYRLVVVALVEVLFMLSSFEMVDEASEIIPLVKRIVVEVEFEDVSGVKGNDPPPEPQDELQALSVPSVVRHSVLSGSAASWIDLKVAKPNCFSG